MKIIIRTFQSVMNKKDKIFLIFSDTDVFVVALNFWDIFAAHGLKVLLIKES